MGLSRGRRLKAAAIAAVGTPIIKGLGRTWRWREGGQEHVAEVLASGRQPIYALWHGRILAGTVYLRGRNIIVMTSENFDGEWIARIIGRLGFTPARGSTSRGGARALAEMRRAMRAGRPGAFTVDGPRGPARVAQPGAVWLAASTGNPILPFHIEASAAWMVSSWDRHLIPKPGSTVAIAIGAPIEIPADTSGAAIEAGRERLQAALAAVEGQARHLLGAL